jgi:hemoglobin
MSITDEQEEEAMRHTSFESLGGFARVRLLVSDFYEKVLESERLAPYFAKVDMRRLIDHQTKFVATILGGPASFSDERLARAHAPLRIAESDFIEMASLFRETLEDFGVGPAEAERLHAHVLGMREQVIGAHATEPT